MQLGTRWTVGATPPPRLPVAVLESVQLVETELAADGVATNQWRWTLTWLEGKPIVELDDGTVIRLDPNTGSATIERSP